MDEVVLEGLLCLLTGAMVGSKDTPERGEEGGGGGGGGTFKSFSSQPGARGGRGI